MPCGLNADILLILRELWILFFMQILFLFKLIFDFDVLLWTSTKPWVQNLLMLNLMVTGALVNRDRSASNHHIYIQFMLFYNLQFITHQGSCQTALKSVIGQTSHRLNMTHPWIQNLEVVIYFLQFNWFRFICAPLIY